MAYEYSDYFLKKGADTNAVDNQKKTPLMYAIQNSMDITQIRKLISHGADVNSVDNDGYSPLIHAVISG